MATGCTSKPKRGAEKPATAPTPQIIGTVKLVDTDAGFVLIESYGSPVPPPGTLLVTQDAPAENQATDKPANPSEKSGATLKVSAEQRRPFLIADIVEGTPKKGDAVRPQPEKRQTSQAPH